MNIFSFASIVVFSAVAVGALIYSILVFCGSKRIINDRVQRNYHVKLYRLHFGFFSLGYSLFAFMAVYTQLVQSRLELNIVLLFVVYGVSGSILLPKSKRLLKNPDTLNEANQTDDNDIKTQGSLMLCGYLLLPVLFLVYAFAFN